MDVGFFGLGMQELAILGCCGTLLVGSLGVLVALFVFGGKKDPDE